MSDVFDEVISRLKQKAKFAQDICQTVSEAWRSWELQEKLEMEEWVRLEDVESAIEQIKRNYVLIPKEKLEEIYKNLEIDKISGYYVNLEFFRLIEELLKNEA